MKIFTITATTIALITGMFAQGTFVHALVVMSLLIYIVVPLALFLSLWILISLKRNGGIPSRWWKTSTILAVIGISLILSFGMGSSIHHLEIRKVRQFVEATVPLLDEFYKKKGVYPSALAEMGILSVPIILGYSSSSSSTSHTFRFEYLDTAGMMDGYEFNSSLRKWAYFD
jgi:amino acid transporter